MENLSKLFNSLDGNIIEYCILGGIIVLVVVLIISIISCIKSLGDRPTVKKKKKIIEKFEDDTLDELDDLDEKDYIGELISVAEEEKKSEEILAVETKEEVKIAQKLEIPEIIEEAPIETPDMKVAPKLDIKSITREMELKLDSEDLSEVDAYEDEQEKTAIISYKELLLAASRIEAAALEEEKNDDVEVVFEFNSKKIVEEENSTPKHAYSSELMKFKPTIDISPVFGPLRSDRYKEQDELLKIEEVDIEETHNIEDKEEFLKNLQDFRSNLD